MADVAVLFAAPRSVYFELAGLDVYDETRDALTWRGGCPVVAHPPCRSWSRLRAFSKAPPLECGLAARAVELVRQWGGVLEHPASSYLWQSLQLPPVSEFDGFSPVTDRWGGWSLCVDQFWWGHRARKRTWLYIVGVMPRQLPPMSLVLGVPSHTCGSFSGRDRVRARPEIGKWERLATPRAFALWLVDLARTVSSSAGVVTPAEVYRGRLGGLGD